MKFLFYRARQTGEVPSESAHITEVLNHLTRMGHTVIYADGKLNEPIDARKPASIPEASQPRSLSAIVKDYVAKSPFRGEALLAVKYLREMKLMLLALRTILRHKPELIYRREGWFSGERLLSRIFNIPVVHEINGIDTDEVRISKRADRLSLKIIDSLERRDLRRADKYVVVTEKLKDVLRDDYGVSEDKITVVENGANTDLFSPMAADVARIQLGLPETANYICFVGMFSRWQGIEYLIEALPYVLKECPDAKALLVGDGEMKNELLEQAGRLGVSDNVVFAGTVQYQSVPLYISASEICVVPKVPLRSGYSPLKLCEYMACSRPVIATRTSGFEVLEENSAGLLVNPADPQEFARAIIKLLQQPELRQQLGQNGREYVVENRSWESVAKKVAEVCEAAIQERKTKGK